MFLRHYLGFLGFIALLGGLGLSTGCANIQAPMGGPRDSLPPVLTKASPLDKTVGFKGGTINLQFDEFVQLDNITQNLLINPPQERYPNVQGKLRNVSIKLKDSLQPNTTYTFNFGNAIRDVNESNPLKNFTYTVSTGSYIDSLTLTGVVMDAETGSPDSTLLVMLHSSPDDSAVAKQKPRFVARPDGKGLFRFSNLPAGRFYLFALKDEGQKRYTSPEIPLAFYPTAVVAGADTLHELRAFVAQKPEARKTTTTPGLRTAANKAAAETKLKYNASTAAGEQDLLGPLLLSFNKPLGGFDSTKILLTDTLFKPLPQARFTLDSTGTLLSLQPNWKADENYRLLLQKGFATDTAGSVYPRTDTLSFKTKPESAYGLLMVKFSGIDASKNPLLQWIQNNSVVLSAPLRGNSYRLALFEPGQYQLRVVYDVNQNGRWDTGNYWQKLQPERVVAISQTFTVKPNWDNEFEVVVQE